MLVAGCNQNPHCSPNATPVLRGGVSRPVSWTSWEEEAFGGNNKARVKNPPPSSPPNVWGSSWRPWHEATLPSTPHRQRPLRKCKARKMAVFVWRSRCVPWTACWTAAYARSWLYRTREGRPKPEKGTLTVPAATSSPLLLPHNSSPCPPDPPMWATILDPLPPPSKHVRGTRGRAKHGAVFLHLLKLLLQSNEPRLLMAFKWEGSMYETGALQFSKQSADSSSLSPPPSLDCCSHPKSYFCSWLSTFYQI